jgi:hypothetical protein
VIHARPLPNGYVELVGITDPTTLSAGEVVQLAALLSRAADASTSPAQAGGLGRDVVSASDHWGGLLARVQPSDLQETA